MFELIIILFRLIEFDYNKHFLVFLVPKLRVHNYYYFGFIDLKKFSLVTNLNKLILIKEFLIQNIEL